MWEALQRAWREGTFDLFVIGFFLTTVFWGAMLVLGWRYATKHWEF